MRVELRNCYNEKRLRETCQKLGLDSETIEALLIELRKEIKKNRAELSTTAGSLSIEKGSIFDTIDNKTNNTLEENSKYTSRIGKKHTSILDHVYFNFDLSDVSGFLEYTLINERYGSFTIKSGRYVDFSKVGTYTPDFHDKDGNILDNNEELKQKYNEHQQKLFDKYQLLMEKGIDKEDARFVLPYSFKTNIQWGIDASALVPLIVSFRKGKYSKNQELHEFGDKLYNILKEEYPAIIDIIDSTKVEEVDNNYFEIANISEMDKQIYSKTDNIDDRIVSSYIYLYSDGSLNGAKEMSSYLTSNDKAKIMDKIFKLEKNEKNAILNQNQFTFEFGVSLIVSKHFKRHRTADLLAPDLLKNLRLNNKVIPPEIEKDSNLKEIFLNCFEENQKMYEYFKEQGVRDEDLTYFALNGNEIKVLMSLRGASLENFLRLRMCNRAQWEINNIADKMYNYISADKNSQIFASHMGPGCVTKGVCPEGKQHCKQGPRKTEQKNNVRLILTKKI